MSSPGIAPGNPPLLSIVVATPPLLPPNNDGNGISSPTAGPALPLPSPILRPPSLPPAEAVASPISPLAEEPIASPPPPPPPSPAEEPAATPPPSPPSEEPIATSPSPPATEPVTPPPPSPPATEPVTPPPPSPPISTPTTPLPSLPSSSPPPQPPPVTPSAKPPLPPSAVVPPPPPLPPSTVVLPPPPLISHPAPTHNRQTPEPPQLSPSTPTTPAPITKPSPKPQPSTSPRSKSSPVEAPPPSSLPHPPPQPPTTRRGRNVPPAKTSTPTATAPPVSSKSPPSISKTLPSKPKTSQPPSTLPTLPVSSPGIASSPSALLVPQPQPPPGINASPAPPGGEGGGGTDMPDPIVASNGTAGKPSVPQGAVVGLCVGGVLLVVLLVFSVLLFVCRKRKKFDDGNVKYSGSTFAGLQGKTKTATEQGLIIKQNINQPGNTRAVGHNNGGSGSSNSLPASAMAFTSPNPPGIAITISTGTFTYEELVAATDGFSISNLLGQGGFGYVHKGVLPNGKEVAVKQLKMGGQQGEREFQAEVETISQVHHKHLVSLVGYCIAGTERLLVYEFVPNQTMEFHLHGTEQPVMEWGTRVKIAVGSAKGLAYLHEDCNPSIIHRDIKAANILLDFNFEAKVADFGLAKIFSNTSSEPITHITTRVVGTFGYLAPEYASSGKVTDKSDVYSFGVMLLELITGRRPITATESDMHRSLVYWARPLLTQAIADGNYDTLADTRLQGNCDTNEMASMVACAAACIRFSASRRPRMSQVIRALEGDLSPSDLDDGIAPRETSVNFPYTDQYMENMRKTRMALTSNVSHATSRYSDTTSEYGLRSSVSSTDSPQIKAMTTDGAQSTAVSSIEFSRLR